MSAAQSWGWNRLDADWSRTIVDTAGIRPGERIVEVGAGTGSLTAALVAAGAQVLAVELHPARVAQLRSRFAGAAVTVVEADAREFHWPRQPFRVLANPPFGISGPLLHALLDPRNSLRRADLVLQRAVVNRYVNETRGAHRQFAMTRGLLLPRSAFTPRPPVDTAVLTVKRIGRVKPKNESRQRVRRRRP
ncbi:MAG: methyltransferase domain-containing protein [Actinomycetota bacterium]|nr:methyltransferase domain-containing protein [Actinomycetota bacterium]